MHVITRSCVLLFWMQTLTFVRSQDPPDGCTLQDFRNGPLFDSNFDTTGLEARYPAGKQIRVSCSIGYSGFFKLSCVEGEWRTRNTKCQPMSCGHPGDAPFADFQLSVGDDFVFGSQVLYTCHKGYQMVSRTSHRRCLSVGWDGVVPTCEAQQCPFIKVNDNVQVIGDPEEANFGNVVRFSCKSNSDVLIGLQEIYCNERGEWSGEAPICNMMRCRVPLIENGRVPGNIQEYKEHEILRFQCNPGFQPSDDRPSKCTKLGLRAGWNPTPECEPTTCKLHLPPLDGTEYDPSSKNVFSPGDTVTVTCGQRHWISDQLQTSTLVSCKGDGQWSLRPVCQEVTCSNRRDPLVYWWDVYRGQQLKLGDRVRYQCKSGYKSMNGATSAACTREGWKPDPLCQAITCDREDIENADIINPQDKYRFNDKANYVCKDGYQGRFDRTCRENGWSRPSQCRAITCDREDIANADIINPKDKYRFNDKANYVCKDGYEGRFDRTCQENGWSGPSQCRERRCKKQDIREAYIYRNERDSYSHGEIAHYRCNKDNERRFSILCEKGVWTGIQSCTDCPKAEVSNGFFAGPYGDKLYYTCNEGYKLFTSGWWAEAECHDRRWPVLHQCIENNACGDVPEISNGEVRSLRSHHAEGESVTITCKKGFTGRVKQLTCRAGNWTSEGLSLTTICEPDAESCSPPPKVQHTVVVGLYQREFLSGSDVTYQCRDSYQMEGDATIRCNDGNWEKHNIVCAQNAAITCKLLLPPLDGTEYDPSDKNVFSPGDTVNVTCAESHWISDHLQTSTLVSCKGDGQWSLIPVCQEVTCSNEKDPLVHSWDVYWGQQKKLGDEVSYRCKSGYRKTDGATRARCTREGWKPDPLCEAQDRDWGTNTQELSSENSWTLHSCAAEMRLSLVLVLLQLWGNVEVSLSQNVCSKPPDVPHAIVNNETKRAEYPQGHVVHFTCETGYISGPTIRYMCSSDGWMVLHKGTCYLKPCQLPDDTPNGYYQIINGDDFVFGATIKYFCNEGYQMVSKEDTRTCYLDHWTNHVPVCDALSCEPPADEEITVKGLPENDEPILPDRFLEISCKVPGKYLNGSTMLICGKDGQWNHPLPTCEDITCEVGEMHPSLRADGLSSGNKTVKIGQKLKFHCDDDYSLKGAGQIECSETGQWNAQFPTCTDKCKFTGVPYNMHVRGPGLQLTQGQKLTFSCRFRGQTLRGKSEVKCLANGQWSDPFPTCGDPLDCQQPLPLENGDTKNSMKFRYRHNEEVEYICQAYHIMQGGPFKRCNNGEWTREIRCLKPCTVDDEAKRTRNLMFRYSEKNKMYAAHDDWIEFWCSTGRPVGSVEMRQKCVDGVLQLPSCQ
ncbi:complement factor H [Pleuronectes platessa]|uniref:complement factor H n=1 Tax=Pleuronectes platessa TaxID=8262 RepID=UPI00232A1B77|nr:complement factor H [Pleuronectes platessa]